MGNEIPLVLSVLVHYNSYLDCYQITSDLESTDYPNHKILIVDNQSNDEEFEKLEILIKNTSAILVRNISNNGYGGGINYGVEYGSRFSPKFIHVLNTDVRIINSSYISELIRVLKENSEFGVIGPAVQTPSGKIQNTIMPFVTIKSLINFKSRFSSLSKIQDIPELKEVDVLNGVCFLVMYDVFKKVKGFDEDFFMYGEEQDFCYRVNKVGYKNYFFGISSIIHFEKISSFDSILRIDWKYLLIRCNQVMYLNKNVSKIDGVLSSFIFLFSILIKLSSKINLHNISFYMVLKALFTPKKFNRNFIITRDFH